jgi:O-acetyl-ADP-ribose deacetylase (regulator of RNase III)
MIVFAVSPLRLELADGDITAESTDAVGNAANNAFWMGRASPAR